MNIMFIHILVINLGTFSVAAWSTYPWKEEARGNPERPAGATKSSETINCLRLIIVYTLVLINNSKAFRVFLGGMRAKPSLICYKMFTFIQFSFSSKRVIYCYQQGITH